MFQTMAKTTSINLRISPEFRDEIERLAAYHGLTMSSYAHSLLVKSVRREIEANGDELGFIASEIRAARQVAPTAPTTIQDKTGAQEKNNTKAKRRTR